MRRVSAFIMAMASGISDDLRDHVAPDKLQHEVETELQKQILSQLVQAIGEYSTALTYDHISAVKRSAAQKKILRFMGYCSEMWVVQTQVKGALGEGMVQEAEAVIF
jgi:hypothetical protein